MYLKTKLVDLKQQFWSTSAT